MLTILADRTLLDACLSPVQAKAVEQWIEHVAAESPSQDRFAIENVRQRFHGVRERLERQG